LFDPDRRTTPPAPDVVVAARTASTTHADPDDGPARAAVTGRWTVVGSVPYRRHLHFDRTAPADPRISLGRDAPTGEITHDDLPDGSAAGLPSSSGASSAGAERERAGAADPAGPGPQLAASAGVREPARPGQVAPGAADVDEPAGFRPDEPAGFGPVAARSADGSPPLDTGPVTGDSADAHGSVEPAQPGAGPVDRGAPVGSGSSTAAAADTRELVGVAPVAIGSTDAIEVVDLDGAGPGEPVDAATVSARPDRWYDRSARLLGVRRALLDPGRRGLRALVVLAVAVVVAAGVVAWRLRPVTDPVEPPRVPAAAPTAQPSASAGSELVISVVGKVRHPGVVRVPAGSRVADAVRAAGGVLPGVDLGLLNQARRLVDGEQIAVGVTPPPDAGGVGAPGGSANPASKVNLNTATADQLDTLPGVGPTLAGRIISFRTEHGGFRSVEQLKQVSGIGDARYADLKDLVTV
jgi:competence protein ComEA